MTGDYVSDLRAFCAEWLKQNRGYDLIDHGFGAEYGGELTTVKLVAMLDELEQLRAIIARVTDRMREYDRHGGSSVNVHQVLNLLSPTWPDGNYEGSPTGGDHG